MNVDLGIWGKLTRVVMFLLLIAGMLGVAVWYLPLIRQNERYRKRIMELEAEVQKQGEVTKQLRASIDSQRYDPKAVERLARERLGYVKAGETIVHFEETGTTNQIAPLN